MRTPFIGFGIAGTTVIIAYSLYCYNYKKCDVADERVNALLKKLKQNQSFDQLWKNTEKKLRTKIKITIEGKDKNPTGARCYWYPSLDGQHYKDPTICIDNQRSDAFIISAIVFEILNLSKVNEHTALDHLARNQTMLKEEYTSRKKNIERSFDSKWLTITQECIHQDIMKKKEFENVLNTLSDQKLLHHEAMSKTYDDIIPQ